MCGGSEGGSQLCGDSELEHLCLLWPVVAAVQPRPAHACRLFSSRVTSTATTTSWQIKAEWTVGEVADVQLTFTQSTAWR